MISLSAADPNKAACNFQYCDDAVLIVTKPRGANERG
jgi:hypothetical protein